MRVCLLRAVRAGISGDECIVLGLQFAKDASKLREYANIHSIDPSRNV